MSEQAIKRQFFFAPNTQLPKDFVENMSFYFENTAPLFTKPAT